jgi:NADH-quinone oxidoreductase subunit C
VTPTEIHARIREHFGDQVLEFDESALNPSIKLASEAVAEVGRYLRDDPELQFNYLMCLSGVDYGPGRPLGVVYHLQSMT